MLRCSGSALRSIGRRLAPLVSLSAACPTHALVLVEETGAAQGASLLEGRIGE